MLGTLQRRAATYQSLQTQAQQLRQLLAVRAAADPEQIRYAGGKTSAPVDSGIAWLLVDQSIAAALSLLGPATNESRFGFDPPPGDRILLRRIRATHAEFVATLDRMLVLDRADVANAESKRLLTMAIAADNELGALTDQLATITRADTDALIAANAGSFTASRDLFVRSRWEASCWRSCSATSSRSRSSIRSSAPKRDSRRSQAGTSHVTSRCPIATSSARSP